MGSDPPTIEGGLVQGLDQVDTVVDALAEALRGAASAGRWDVVAQLARELEARRLASSGNVVPLPKRAPQR